MSKTKLLAPLALIDYAPHKLLYTVAWLLTLAKVSLVH